MVITQEVRTLWEVIYLPNGITTKEKHKRFASMLSIPYHEAKELCYKVAYSLDFIKGLMQDDGGDE